MLRSAVFALATAALCTTVVSAIAAEHETFTFAPANAPKTGLGEDRLQITINRWSTDAERDQVAALLAANDAQSIRHTLGNADVVGRLRWPGGLDYALRYARRTPRADGGADVILVTDSRVWVWWDSKADLALDEPFTVIHVRLDKNGIGQGRVAPASKARSDKSFGVAVTDLDTRPALMTDVRAQRG